MLLAGPLHSMDWRGHLLRLLPQSPAQKSPSPVVTEKLGIKTEINEQGERPFWFMWSGVFNVNCWLCNSPLIMCTPGQGSRQPASDHPASSFSFRTSSDPPFSSFFHFLAPPHSNTGFHLLKQKLTVLLSVRSRASFFLQERWKNKHVYADTFCRFQIHICKLHYSSAPPPSCWEPAHTYT